MRAASYCDVTLTYCSDTVSMDAFIITMTLPARAFQHGGSSSWSSQDLSLCIASFSWLNRNWPLIRSALSWFVLPLLAQHSWGRPQAAATAGPTHAVPGVAAQTTPAQTVSWSIPITVNGSNHGLPPGRHQAIIWTNFGEILIEILTFAFTIMRLKAWSAKWLPVCLGLNVLR